MEEASNVLEPESRFCHMQGKKPAWVRSLTCGQVRYTSCMRHISDEYTHTKWHHHPTRNQNGCVMYPPGNDMNDMKWYDWFRTGNMGMTGMTGITLEWDYLKC